MRLLSLQEDGRVSLTSDTIEDIPPYAILSHTWGNDEQEVIFQDLDQGSGQRKDGYQKVVFCGKQAACDGIKYFWVDTCCINKANSTELQEAITSMFRWYQESARCYVYLPDVYIDDLNPTAWEPAFRRSRWFTRGWTLQELLAPSAVEFFDKDGKRLGDRASLINLLHDITGISTDALRGYPLSTFSVEQRMRWAEGRVTKRKEDKAYSLVGIFDVSIFLNYGEGEEHAMNRLREEIQRHSGSKAGQGPYYVVPLGRNKAFVGRDHILDELMKMIPPGAEPQSCQRIAIEGLGGVGKTQIALEAAFRVRERDTDCSVFWVPAINRATFENGYRDIAQALKIPGIDDDKADVKVLVKDALSKNLSSWLLVIDNADDTELLFNNIDGYDVRDYLPLSTKGSILFTTRNHETAVRLDILPEQVLAVDEMSKYDALKMLEKLIKPNQMQDTKSTNDLLELLVYLPLAIKQASAYMFRTGISTEKYLEYYRQSDESQIKLSSNHFEDRGRYREIANPIATTWLISFRHIEKNYPLAIRYLKFICFLAEKDIPKLLLRQGGGEMEMDEALGVLKGYAFILEHGDPNFFDIHRLVGLATRNWVGLERTHYITAVIQQLSQTYPYPKHENRHIWVRYMPHAEAVLSASQGNHDPEATAFLFHVVGSSNEELGRDSRAEQMYRQALKLRQGVLGLKHPNTLASMGNLAHMLGILGKSEESEQISRQTLKLSQGVLGPEHPNTLASMNNHTLVLGRLGKYKESEQISRQTLKLSQGVLGLEHPSTLVSMNNHTLVLGRLGKYKESEQISRQTLKLMQGVLGPEHPNTLASMHNHTLVLVRLGKYKESEQISRQTLKLMQGVLGPEHPNTLTSMDYLAHVLTRLGKYKESEQISRQTLKLSQGVLGLEHPSTLVSMDNLAHVLGRLGKYEESEQISRQTLKLSQGVLGPKHPSTLTSMNNHATLLDQMGQHEDAKHLRQSISIE
ncbi:kinesin light chain 1 [Xylariales sp. AK1849]|nr:kinesin light chain 1 [Xylariales sp. AK1849]